MVKWIKDAVDKLPREYGNIILFATLTGHQITNLMSAKYKWDSDLIVGLISDYFGNSNENICKVIHSSKPYIFQL
jgi:hypothetical protein